MENHPNFEHALVQLVAELIEEKSISNTDFGNFVFGKTSGARIWRMCRRRQRERDISVNEAVRMAEFLSEHIKEFAEFPTFIWQINQQAKARGLLDLE